MRGQRRGHPVTDGTIELQEHEVAGEPVSCDTPGLCTAGNIGAVCPRNACGLGGVCTPSSFVTISSGTPDASGQFAVLGTTGLGNSTSGLLSIGLLSQYVGGDTGFISSVSACADLTVVAGPIIWEMFHHDLNHSGPKPV